MRFYAPLTRGSQRRARFQPHLFRHETPKATAKRMNSSKFESRVNAPRSPEPSETASSRRRPKLGLGVAVRRLSSREQYRIHGISSRTPSNSGTLSPGRNEPDITSSALSEEPKHFPAVQEVWFAGCHSDVGGGAVEDTVRYSLGDISLRWMVKQVRLSDCGIVFDDTALRIADIDITTNPARRTVEQLWRRESEIETADISSAPLTPSGEGDSEEDMIRGWKKKDVETQVLSQEPEVLADIHDELEYNRSGAWILYRLLEMMPVTFTWQEIDGTDQSKRKYGITNTTL